MTCPRCHAEALPNEDQTFTCLNCGLVFHPKDYRPDELVNKMVEEVSNLRSLIVTLSTGQAVTFSYPKDLEPTEEVERETWRDLLTQHIIVTCIWVFCVGIANTVFDDEIEVKRG